MKKIIVSPKDLDDLVIFATRYCIGRHSIGAIMFAKYTIPKYWDSISRNIQTVIHRDIKEHLEWCDNNPSKYDFFNKQDNPVWEELLKLKVKDDTCSNT